MAQIQVSIVIPTFNEEVHLPRCLDSINHLDFPAGQIEVIVIDNGSTDRTREIAVQWGAVLLRDDNLNVSGLRNMGARHARGPVLAFLDADCMVAKDWLQRAAKYFTDDKVAVWGAPPRLPQNPTWVQETWFLIRKKERDVQKVDWLESMNCFIRRSLFLKIGGFDESLVTCEDVDICYRAARHGEILSDGAIQVVHLGEAATLRDFVRKEIWRGQGNLQGVGSHGFSLKEIPSLAIPLYFGLFMPIIIIYAVLFHQPSYYLMIALMTFLIPAALVAYRKRQNLSGPSQTARLIVLLQAYFFARTVAVFKRGR
jgi:glycosyltransferase involved in cell wall biosynthesis